MVKLEIFNLFDCGSYAGPDYAAMRFVDWIRDRIDSNPKLKRIGLARALNVDPSTITNMLNGKRRIKAEEISIIADYIGEPWPFNDSGNELAPEPVTPTKIPLRGEIAAGVWLEAPLLDERSIAEDYSAFLPAELAGESAVFAMKVNGESINRIAPAGALLICTPDKTTADELSDRMVIIIRQFQPDTGLTELSCRRVRRVGDAIDLIAESHDPAYAKPVRLAPESTPGRTIEILGRVRYVITPV